MKRDIAIDLMKFCAVLLIINSHCGVAYPGYEYLATGGAIGNSLFFFISGFLVSYKQTPANKKIESVCVGGGTF